MVSGKRRFPRRHTIFIGPKGKILFIDKAVKARTHGADIVKKLEELGVEKAK